MKADKGDVTSKGTSVKLGTECVVPHVTPGTLDPIHRILRFISLRLLSMTLELTFTARDVGFHKTIHLPNLPLRFLQPLYVRHLFHIGSETVQFLENPFSNTLFASYCCSLSVEARRH